MIKVFYDGKCNMCSKEINYYRKISPSGIFDWQDVNFNNNDLINEGIKTSDALKLLHVIDTNNKLHIGIDAFIVIWKNLKYWNTVAKLVALPIIKQISHFIYIKFAKWRFNRLTHCIIAKENDKKL